MADTTTLHEFGCLLAPEHQARFAEILRSFEELPDDDEAVQMATLTGMVALAMSNIPEQLSTILEAAHKILTSSLDVPNYKDMSAMTRTIRETTQKNHDESRRLIDTLGHLQHEVRRNSRLSPILACSFATIIITLAIGAVAAFFWLPKLLNEPITVPKHLWPYVELQRERRLYHFDSKLPNLTDEDVRIMRIKEGVLDAFREGDDAVIVLEKPMPDEVSDQSSTN